VTESSDEASHAGTDWRVPREPIERLAAVIKFLGSYNNDVEQIECALGNLLQKDEKISHLSLTITELQNSKNEEFRRVEEEQSRLAELQRQLNDEKTSLEISRQTLDEDRKQLEEEKNQFKAQETARYDKTLATEKKKIGDEFRKLIKQEEKATAMKMEQATQQIQQLQDQVSDLTVAKETAETTLSLFRTHTKDLTDQQKELESRYRTQDFPLSEL
jgi:chromosome segregation ATPase